MTFDAIKAAVKGLANLSSQEADSRIGDAINRHHRRVTSSLGLDPTRRVTRSEDTTDGVRTITFENIEKIDIVYDATNGNWLTEGEYDAVKASTATGAPSQWAVESVTATTVTILLDSTPDEYSLQATGKASLADLEGNDEPAIAESYHDILTFSVLAEELLKKEKVALAREYATGDEERPGRAETLLAQYRFSLADSPTRTNQQGSRPAAHGFASGSGSSTLGATAYTQSALLTFDRGSGLAPFAVAQSNAAVVTNLDADKLDGQHGSYYLDRSNHTSTQAYSTISSVTTDSLVGRDTAGTGAAELITLNATLSMTGSNALQRAALTGDVTASAGSNATTIANDAVTYAKMQNVSATSRLLGRASSGSGDVEEITIGTGLDINTTTLTASALRTPANGSTALAIDSTAFIDSATQPRSIAYHSTTQTIATTSATALSLDSEDVDVGSMHSTSSNTSRITIPTGGDGLYLILGQASSDGAVANGNLYIGKNGSGVISQYFANGTQVIRISGLLSLAAADYVELLVIQNASTSTVYGSGTAAAANRLAVVKLW